MDNLKALERLMENEEMEATEKVYILVSNLLDCLEHDEEMTNRCNLLSGLWQSYRDSTELEFPKSVYIDCVEMVLKSSRETITRLVKEWRDSDNE